MEVTGEKYGRKGTAYMERLNYEVLKKSGYDGYILKDAPEKVLPVSYTHLFGQQLLIDKGSGREFAGDYLLTDSVVGESF